MFNKIIIFLFSFLYLSQFVSAQSLAQVDSIFVSTLKMPDDTNKVNTLNETAWFCINNSYLQKAYEIADKSYKISKNINYTKGIAYATKSIAAVYFYQGEIDDALLYYTQSHSAFVEINDKKGISIALRNLGNVYHQIGDYNTAIDYYFKSLEIREDLHDKAGIAAVYGAIGLVYMEQGKKERASALQYFKKSLAIEIELDNKSGIAQKYLYIGNVFAERYKEEKDTILSDSAYDYFYRCKKLAEETDNLYYLIMAQEALGLNYMQRGDYHKAYEYYTNALELHEKVGNKFGMASVYFSIGLYFQNIGKNNEAKKYFLQSHNLALEISAPEIIKETSASLSAIYAEQKLYKEAFNFQMFYLLYKDSLQSQENTKKMTQLAMQYEFDKKDKLQQLEKQKREELYKSELKRQKMTRNFFVAGFGFMLIFVFFILRSYKQKKKANKMLEEKNAEINAQKEEIEQQRDNAVKSKEIIAEQHKHITDSIVYAQRIQQAVLPPDDDLNKLLYEYFVLYKPRDIVSGDYYWATRKDKNVILTAADCTGHGVPGAFMSLLGTSFLNEIVNKFDTSSGRELNAGEILDLLREAVKKSLRQTGKDSEAKDGMDMSLVIIDFENMKMQYAGANNPILLVRDKKLIELGI